jgi:hypothetical protein
MPDFRATAARLRADGGCRDDLPLSVERLLPRLYPVATLVLPRLSVSQIRQWLPQHGAGLPPALAVCRDRPLRGAVLAWRGHGFLCVDGEDPDPEQRFTFAHEAAHFLQDHLYPRQDLLHRYGASLLPVLDGLRLPSPAERVDALLGRASLTLHTHLLDRGAALGPSLRPRVEASEADADFFACEMLAPTAALEARFRDFRADENAADRVRSVLVEEFGLPPAPAAMWARRFVSRHGEPVTLLHRLGLS